MVWCGVVWCGVVWCGVVWCGVMWCGVLCYGMVWQSIVRYDAMHYLLGRAAKVMHQGRHDEAVRVDF